MFRANRSSVSLAALVSAMTLGATASAEDAWTEMQKRGAVQEGRQTGSEVEAERANERELAARRNVTRIGVFASPVYFIPTDNGVPGGPGLQAGALLTSGLSLRTEIQVRLGLSVYAMKTDLPFQFGFSPSPDQHFTWISPGVVLESTVRFRPLSPESIWLLGVGALAQVGLGGTSSVSGTNYFCCSSTTPPTPGTRDLSTGIFFLVGGLVESVWKLGDEEKWELSVRLGVGAFVGSDDYPKVVKDSSAVVQPGLAIGRLF